MKSIISICTILFICGCFGKNPNLETGHEGKPIPSINLLMLDSSTHINTKTWRKENPLVLIDISPYCPYCRLMTQNIINDNKEVSNIQFILLSSFPLNELRKYYTEYKLKNYPNIILARDFDASFGQYFNSPGVPCIAIYGQNRLLKKVLIGKVNTTLIKDIAFE